jgi:hypothetical protein
MKERGRSQIKPSYSQKLSNEIMSPSCLQYVISYYHGLYKRVLALFFRRGNEQNDVFNLNLYSKITTATILNSKKVNVIIKSN